MSLIAWLGIVIALLIAVRLLDARRGSARASALTTIARTAKMNYSAIDRFDLERRLQHSSAFTGGLTVRDVLYSTRDERRLFVATLERRATEDDSARAFVVACAEPLDHSELKLLSVPAGVRGSASTLAAYRAALERLERPQP